MHKNLIKNLAIESANQEEFLKLAKQTYDLVRKQVNQELKNGIGSVSDIREELLKEDQILTAEEDVFNPESQIATHRLMNDQLATQLQFNFHKDAKFSNVNDEDRKSNEYRSNPLVPKIRVHGAENLEVVSEIDRVPGDTLIEIHNLGTQGQSFS